VIEPPDPVQGSKLHVLEATPGPLAVDHLRLEEADDRLGQSVIVAVPRATHRGLDACLGKSLGVADGEILNAAVAMLDELLITLLFPLADGLLESVQSKVAPERARYSPVHDPAAICIDYGDHVYEPLLGNHIRQV